LHILYTVYNLAMATLLDARPLAEQAHAELRRLILSGALPLGSALAEESLATQLGISRTPIREALRRLSEEGLVDAGSRARARVASIDDATADGIVAVRAELDALAAACCARRGVDGNTLRALRQAAAAIDTCLANGDLGASFAADGAFHLALGEASGNRELVSHLTRLEGRVQLVRLYRCGDPSTVRKNVSAHRKLLAAIAARDGDLAAQIARDHATSGAVAA
jgi:GntR family transcriptional regulator, rspAB operon transcriptional repressor